MVVVSWLVSSFTVWMTVVGNTSIWSWYLDANGCECVLYLVAGRAFAGEGLFTPMLAGVLVFMFLPLAKRCVVGGALGFLIFAVGFHDFLCWRKGARWRCRWFSDLCSWFS